ncbi:MAG: Fic family protein [Kiritimatiellae bacterium]|nr:Fic family protein [Kiritimatiellia bacterium]
MDKRVFRMCDGYAAKIAALRPFPEETLSSLRAYYRVGLTYSSNALEGNSLTESETKVVIEDGLTIGGKPLRDVYEAAGHARAYDFLFDISKDRPVGEADILELHRLFHSQIDKDNAGRWRKVRVFISGSRRVLPAPEKVPGLMAAFVRWMAENEGKLHPVEFAARVHQKFVFIHPFVDGNGRVARLLMNLALLRAGWTIAVIPPICRSEYIAALDKAGRSPGDFIRFIASRVCETQKELLRLMGQSTVLGGDRVNPPNGDRVNDGVNENAVAVELLSAIVRKPGLRTHELAAFIGKSIPTVSRYLKTLKDAGKIEFRGAPKNGGYFAV